MSLSDYIKRELEHSAALPAMREWIERTGRMKPVRGGKTAAQVIREMRDSR